MQRETWNLDNEWLNNFSQSFVGGTHRLIRNISIDLDANCVIVRGCAQSYYAVQLAIHATWSFHREHPRFAETLLLLTVADRSLELNLAHAIERTQELRAPTRPSPRYPELTVA